MSTIKIKFQVHCSFKYHRNSSTLNCRPIKTRNITISITNIEHECYCKVLTTSTSLTKSCSCSRLNLPYMSHTSSSCSRIKPSTSFFCHSNSISRFLRNKCFISSEIFTITSNNTTVNRDDNTLSVPSFCTSSNYHLTGKCFNCFGNFTIGPGFISTISICISNLTSSSICVICIISSIW